MNKKRYLIGLLFIAIVYFGSPVSVFAQEAKVNWLSIEEAEALSKKEPRKIFIDFYTDWCGWCKRMEANTFSHPYIAEYINKNYYPVKFNAEQSDPVTFRGQEFLNENPGQRRSAHNFAVAVLQGRMGYPSVAFIDEDLNLITTMSGYRPPEKLEPVLVFFKDDVYKQSSDLDAFIESFTSKIE